MQQLSSNALTLIVVVCITLLVAAIIVVAAWYFGRETSSGDAPVDATPPPIAITDDIQQTARTYSAPAINTIATANTTATWSDLVQLGDNTRREISNAQAQLARLPLIQSKVASLASSSLSSIVSVYNTTHAALQAAAPSSATAATAAITTNTPAADIDAAVAQNMAAVGSAGAALQAQAAVIQTQLNAAKTVGDAANMLQYSNQLVAVNNQIAAMLGVGNAFLRVRNMLKQYNTYTATLDNVTSSQAAATVLLSAQQATLQSVYSKMAAVKSQVQQFSANIITLEEFYYDNPDTGFTEFQIAANSATTTGINIPGGRFFLPTSQCSALKGARSVILMSKTSGGFFIDNLCAYVPLGNPLNCYAAACTGSGQDASECQSPACAVGGSATTPIVFPSEAVTNCHDGWTLNPTNGSCTYMPVPVPANLDQWQSSAPFDGCGSLIVMCQNGSFQVESGQYGVRGTGCIYSDNGYPLPANATSAPEIQSDAALWAYACGSSQVRAFAANAEDTTAESEGTGLWTLGSTWHVVDPTQNPGGVQTWSLEFTDAGVANRLVAQDGAAWRNQLYLGIVNYYTHAPIPAQLFACPAGMSLSADGLTCSGGGRAYTLYSNGAAPAATATTPPSPPVSPNAITINNIINNTTEFMQQASTTIDCIRPPLNMMWAGLTSSMTMDQSVRALAGFMVYTNQLDWSAPAATDVSLMAQAVKAGGGRSVLNSQWIVQQGGTMDPSNGSYIVPILVENDIMEVWVVWESDLTAESRFTNNIVVKNWAFLSGPEQSFVQAQLGFGDGIINQNAWVCMVCDTNVGASIVSEFPFPVTPYCKCSAPNMSATATFETVVMSLALSVAIPSNFQTYMERCTVLAMNYQFPAEWVGGASGTWLATMEMGHMYAPMLQYFQSVDAAQFNVSNANAQAYEAAIASSGDALDSLPTVAKIASDVEFASVQAAQFIKIIRKSGASLTSSLFKILGASYAGLAATYEAQLADKIDTVEGLLAGSDV